MENYTEQLPTVEDLKKLPNEFVVAYALRNALRAFPTIEYPFFDANEESRYYKVILIGLCLKVLSTLVGNNLKYQVNQLTRPIQHSDEFAKEVYNTIFSAITLGKITIYYFL